MTIITIDSDNNQEVFAALADIIQTMGNDDNCTGHTSEGIDFEFQVMPEQKFVHMADFLLFDESGNQLKINDRQ